MNDTDIKQTLCMDDVVFMKNGEVEFFENLVKTTCIAEFGKILG